MQEDPGLERVAGAPRPPARSPGAAARGPAAAAAGSPAPYDWQRGDSNRQRRRAARRTRPAFSNPFPITNSARAQKCRGSRWVRGGGIEPSRTGRRERPGAIARCWSPALGSSFSMPSRMPDPTARQSWNCGSRRTAAGPGSAAARTRTGSHHSTWIWVVKGLMA